MSILNIRQKDIEADLPTNLVRSTGELSITNAPAAGKVLLGTDSKHAAFGESTIPEDINRIKALGNVAGKVKPNLNEGRAFTMTTTNSLELENPINPPGSTKLIEVVYFIIGNHKIDFPGLAGWLFGSKPPLEPSSPTALTVVVTVSFDGGTTYWGTPGVEGLPADVPRVASVSEGQMIVYNAGTQKYEGRAIPSSLSQIAIEALINEHFTLPSSENKPGVFPIANAEGHIEWLNFTEELFIRAAERLHIGEPINKNTTLPIEVLGSYFFQVTKASVTIKLPVGWATLAGSLRMFENFTTGPVKIEGPFTPGSSTVTVEEIYPGELVTFFCDNGATHWSLQSRRRRDGDVTELVLENVATKTSNQITKAFELAFAPEKPPRNGQSVVDFTNKVKLTYNSATTKWWQSAVMSEKI